MPAAHEGHFIKRVVAVGGDRLKILDGRVYIDGKRQKEPFISPCAGCEDLPKAITVPKGYYFMMGDNRGHSQDSRVWGRSRRTGSSARRSQRTGLRGESAPSDAASRNGVRGRNRAIEAKFTSMPSAPRRPNYVSGQLLTTQDFEAEQSYFLDGRRSDNRHLRGWGVVCGLGVTPSGRGGVVIEPGLAIDGLGREIVVPDPQEMPDPRQPIDDRGEPCGEPVDSEVITICLAYAERSEDGGDPARFVRETYTLEVSSGPAEPPPRNPAAEAVLAGSTDEVASALCEAAAGETCDPADQFVPIATVEGRKGEVHVAVCPRRTVAATDVLLELILGLVRRVQALEQRS